MSLFGTVTIYLESGNPGNLFYRKTTLWLLWLINNEWCFFVSKNHKSSRRQFSCRKPLCVIPTGVHLLSFNNFRDGSFSLRLSSLGLDGSSCCQTSAEHVGTSLPRPRTFGLPPASETPGYLQTGSRVSASKVSCLFWVHSPGTCNYPTLHSQNILAEFKNWS